MRSETVVRDLRMKAIGGACNQLRASDGTAVTQRRKQPGNTIK
ncbi:hypothetical protein HMPREF1981_02393 [Bacteroides pyogenes F0041]|uniref:Uncharacterized protein n=1 Tax=Bacteroides pyogenes F0041 TaxID=1321819 RepID=U2DS56_9BACE|nr:hypothetical protein HMPREF1981_02393 [Bacteroides pyogenes F0041]